MRARRGKATGLTALDRQPRRRVERTSRLPNQPVSQRDKLGSPIPSARVVSMLDRMRRNPAFFVKGENEQPSKLLLIRQFEDGCIPAQKHTETLVDAILRRSMAELFRR